MTDSRKYRVYPNDLDLRTAFSGVYEHLQRSGFAEDTKCHCEYVTFRLTLSDDRSLSTRTSQEFLNLLPQYPRPQAISTHCHWQKADAEIHLSIDLRRSGIDASITAFDLMALAGLHDKIAEVFGARNPEVEKGRVARYELRPTVFLAHRFDEQGRRYADALQRFLRRLGFEVLEGEGYEARDIPEKVADRIRSQDILVCVVSEGDAAWILSEIAFAKGLQKYIVILVQDDLPFKKGIIGTDYEHMTFPKGFIEKAYTDLLYALPSK